MYQVIVGMKTVGEFEKFTEAFKKFYEKIVETLKSGTSLQWLETSNYLVYISDNVKIPMDFYNARDFSYDIGLLVDGELQEIEEPDEPTVKMAFLNVAANHIESQAKFVLDKLCELSTTYL